MNRRAFILASASLPVAVSEATNAHQAMQMVLTELRFYAAQATPANTDREAFDFQDFSGPQVMYVGILATWMDLGMASIDRFIASIERMADSPTSKSAQAESFMAIGAWPLLYEDIEPLSAPAPFTDTHAYLVEAFRNLERAALYFRDGIVLMDTGSLDTAATYLSKAQESLESGAKVIPVSVPSRSIVED